MYSKWEKKSMQGGRTSQVLGSWWELLTMSYTQPSNICWESQPTTDKTISTYLALSVQLLCSLINHLLHMKFHWMQQKQTPALIQINTSVHRMSVQKTLWESEFEKMATSDILYLTLILHLYHWKVEDCGIIMEINCCFEEAPKISGGRKGHR